MKNDAIKNLARVFAHAAVDDLMRPRWRFIDWRKRGRKFATLKIVKEAA